MQLAFARRDGFACSLIAQATLPLPASLLFEVLVHPENAAILRSLDRCTHRLVLEGDGCGRLACEVEHETCEHVCGWQGEGHVMRGSMRCSRSLAPPARASLPPLPIPPPTTPPHPPAACHFLWFSGTVRTPLSVEQDASELTMRYSLRGRCGHLLQLQGCWRITDGGAMRLGGAVFLLCHLPGLSSLPSSCACLSLPPLTPAPHSSPRLTPHPADGPSRSVLHAEQSFTPRGLPPLLGGAVRSWAAAQVRCSKAGAVQQGRGRGEWIAWVLR